MTMYNKLMNPYNSLVRYTVRRAHVWTERDRRPVYSLTVSEQWAHYCMIIGLLHVHIIAARQMFFAVSINRLLHSYVCVSCWSTNLTDILLCTSMIVTGFVSTWRSESDNPKLLIKRHCRQQHEENELLLHGEQLNRVNTALNSRSLCVKGLLLRCVG